MSCGPSLDSTYLSNKNAGVKLDLIIPALEFSFISLLGIPLNLSVCYITFLYRKQYSALGSKTAILICINSLFDIFSQTSHFLFLYVTGTGINFIPFKNAIIFHTHVVIGFCSAFFMMYSLSFDRLLAVAFPIYYSNLKHRTYIFVHLLIILIYNCFIIYRIIQVVIQFPEWPVNGSVGDTLGMLTMFSSIWTYFFLSYIFAPAVISYIIIGIIIKFIKISSINDKKNKLWRSLFIIVFLNIGCYLLNFSIIIFVLTPIKCTDPIHFYNLIIFPGLFINLSGMATAPILFINSTDYNKAYKKEFNKIKYSVKKCLGMKQNNIIIVKPCSNTVIKWIN
ncbi:hypothetical protein Mgra_00008583 [Meloidogyne graminicola]|uniref:G-protein coupled receptors family 1 profile domain-containing protein n=1 Tax=Meloidogyne graminicola TaxID=189291 RepID=A0A8S9ZFD2_9BILA|nr:hypothetical protein Mgra_00008583 [Meloidogyne graminicola]